MFSILYVDDERALLEIGKIFLEQFAEFSVDIHTSAREALASQKFRSYDAIISDYQMPGMDGIEFLRTVRTRFGDIPFIIFTGRGREEVVIQAINNGADFYLQKGGDPDAQFAELAHKVRQAIARRRAELSLIESEKRLYDIINFLPDATFAIDRSGTVIAWNRAIVEMTGIAASTMLGKGDYEYAIPFYGARRPILIDLIFEPDEIIAKNYSHIIHEKDLLIADTTLPRPKGKPLILMGKASPLYNRQGEIVGAIESIRDITELKKAEEDVSHAKKDWETIFRAIGHPALVLDSDNRIIDANDATLKISGRPMDELKGKRCYDVFHNPGTVAPPECCPFEQLKKTGTIGAAEIEIEAFNGFYHVSCTPVFDAAGRVEKVIHIAMDVTERRRAQDELKAAYEQISASEEELRSQLDEIVRVQQDRAKTEENFRMLVDNAPDAIYIQTNNRFVYLNNAALRLLGATAVDQLLGKDTYDRIHPSFHEPIRKRVKSLTIDLQPVELLEEVYLKLDGTSVEVEVTAVPFQYQGEHGALVMVRDITIRKQAEAELHAAYEQIAASQEELRGQYDELAQSEQRIRESEEKFRGIFENTTVALFRTRLDGSIETANPAFAQLLGYETPEKAIRAIPDMRKIYVFPELRDTLFKTLVDKGAAKDFELALKRPDWSIIWASVNVRALFDKRGNITGLDGLAVDITERKNAEEALRQSEERFRSLIELSPVPIVLARDSRIMYTNSAFSSLVGVEESGSLQDKSLLAFIAPESRDLVAGYMEARQRGETVPENYEAVGLRANGIRFPYEINVAFIQLSDGPVTMAFISDISSRKRSEEELKAAFGQISASEEELRRKYEELALSRERICDSEEKFRAIFEKTHDALVVFTAQGCIDCNQRAVSLFGYRSREEFLGLHPADISPPFQPDGQDSESAFAAHIQTVFENFRDEFEWLQQKKDGSTFLADVLLSAFELDGKPVFLSSVRDITERKRADEALRQANLVVENSPVVAFRWKAAEGWPVAYVSNNVTGFGYTPEELVSGVVPYSLLVHPDDLGRVSDEVQNYSRDGIDQFRQEYRIISRDSRVHWVDDRTVIERDADGLVTYYQGILIDITERKLAEQKIQNTIAFLNALIDQNPNPMWISDEKGFLIRMNAACNRLLHSTEAELAGKYNIFDDNIVKEQGFMPLVKSVFEEGRVVSFPLTYDSSRLDTFELKETVSLVLEVTIFPIKDAAGKFTNAIIINNDITRRKRAEEALRESEARLRSIMHGSPDLQFVIDQNHRVISWNKAIEEYSGVKAEDIIGTDEQWRAFYKKKRPVLADLLVDGDTDSLVQWYGEKLRKSRYVEGAYEAINFSPYMGTQGIWLSFTAAPIRDAQGMIIGAVETLEDITERVNAEKAIRESEEWSRTILNTAQAGIILVDGATHRIIDANSKALALIGLPRDSVIGKVCHRFLCPEREGKCPVIDCGQKLDTAERVLLTATGSRILVLKTVVPVSMGGRSILVESFVDISEQKRSEAAIQEANRKLNLLNSITRHDVANQVSILRGFTKIAQKKKPDTSVVDLLEKIDTAASAIARQIEFTKTYQELGMHAPCWNRIDEIATKLKPDGVTVSSVCRGAEIFADPMLEKVFLNLFDNAVRHGKRVTAITVRCERETDGLAVIVEDNGTGIAAGDKDKIFERGFGKNTGLGLFLVKEILTITGITIRETGIPGKGARFEMLVPENAFRFST